MHIRLFARVYHGYFQEFFCVVRRVNNITKLEKLWEGYISRMCNNERHLTMSTMPIDAVVALQLSEKRSVCLQEHHGQIIEYAHN